MERVLHLLGRDKVDVALSKRRGQDAPFAGDDLGFWSDDDSDVGAGWSGCPLAIARCARPLAPHPPCRSEWSIDQRVVITVIHRTFSPP